MISCKRKRMAGSLAGSSLRRSPHRRPFSVELEFDPCELIGTLIPFVDPFGYDERDFRAEAFFSTSSQPSVHAGATGAVPISRSRVGLLQCSSLIPALRFSTQLVGQEIVQPAAVALDTDVQTPQAGLVRTRLTADQAIFIFCKRRSKTVRTAALLAAEYGITPKAVRDIWTLKSWATQTKPYWSLIDEA